MAARPDDPDDAVPHRGPDVPGPGDDAHEPTDDERWDAIVAQLGDLADYDGADETDGHPSGDAPPAAPPLAPGATGWPGDARVVRAVRGPVPEGPARGPRDADGPDPLEEEHFEPPDPGPVLGGDPLLTMAWFAAAGMPVFLLVVLVAWRDAPSALVQAAAVVFVIGVAVLVWRMPHRRDPEDHDNGAVV